MGLFSQMFAFNRHHLTDIELDAIRDRNLKILLFTGDADEVWFQFIVLGRMNDSN
jgi:hypothetical protein